MKDENIEHKPGCWLEPDGQGRHCMCYTDFCNRLEKKAPTYPLLPDAQFLKHNPLLDYHDHNSDSGEGDGSVPMPENVLFPAAMTADPRTAGSADYEDLVPIDFAEYDREWNERNAKQSETEKTLDKVQDRVQDLASSARLPSWMLMTMTLATSIARLLAYI
ncbi:hypothetical protein GCK32_015783 [Trichostrongylus colubriformis]|uniref:Uncharacterized protein n=1 Tax=Trichostrongylus colubriformis TaxID=6319 RepID=A0AAN8IEW0_TRICO